MEITALIPMRHHSQRVPGKNCRLLDGKPLYQHILQTLQNCPEITRIAVDTDSQEIVDGLHRSFPGVVVIPRPEVLKDGKTP